MLGPLLPRPIAGRSRARCSWLDSVRRRPVLRLSWRCAPRQDGPLAVLPASRADFSETAGS
jgi:hypothetical protein